MSKQTVRGIPRSRVQANIILARAALELHAVAGSVLGQRGMLFASSGALVEAISLEDIEAAREAFSLWEFELNQARAAIEDGA